MIQNEIYCNQRCHRLVSSKHGLIHDINPSFLRKNLEHRHECLYKNLCFKISNEGGDYIIYTICFENKLTHLRKSFEFSEVTKEAEELHGNAGGYH